MINGDRCTRACDYVGRHASRAGRPGRAGKGGRSRGPTRLAHAVVTSVARDDLDDGGAGASPTVDAIRRRCPGRLSRSDLGLQGGPGVARADLRRPPDVLTRTWKRFPVCNARSVPPLPTPGVWPCGPAASGLTTKSGRSRMGSPSRKLSGAGRPASDRRIHSDDRAVPAAQRQPPARSPLVVSGRLREDR